VYKNSTIITTDQKINKFCWYLWIPSQIWLSA
jgi:hypothetical protein